MKFIKSNYENGHSLVVIRHLKHRFYGTADVHPDDKKNTSEFAGCILAEMRAQIKALKYERRLAKEEAEICRKFIKACETSNTWNKNSNTAKIAYHQLNCKIKRVNKLTDEINDLLFKINKYIVERDITLKAFERNKQNRLNQNSKN